MCFLFIVLNYKSQNFCQRQKWPDCRRMGYFVRSKAKNPEHFSPFICMHIAQKQSHHLTTNVFRTFYTNKTLSIKTHWLSFHIYKYEIVLCIKQQFVKSFWSLLCTFRSLALNVLLNFVDLKFSGSNAKTLFNSSFQHYQHRWRAARKGAFIGPGLYVNLTFINGFSEGVYAHEWNIHEMESVERKGLT